MQRIVTVARRDWRAGLRQYPYGEGSSGAASHWQEGAYYAFSAAEIDRIEEAADELHAMVVEAVRHVVEQRLHPLLGFPPGIAQLIDANWNAYWDGGRFNPREGGLVGRLDLAYDGRDRIKLLGCQYDGPTGLFEASIVQWSWLEAKFPDADQFNGLHEALVERWQMLSVGMRDRTRIHLTCATPDPERQGELVYLAATAQEAGITPVLIPIQEIGWDGRRFRDLEEAAIAWLLKLYPWELLLDEAYGHHVGPSGVAVLEPIWRMLASNHGMLAVLWELYPEHPNLVPAALSESEIDAAGLVTRCALFGLDQAETRLTRGGKVVAERAGTGDGGGTVYLATPPLFEQNGVHALLQAWLVGDKCLGMTVRESPEPIIGPEAEVVPHLFR